MKKILMTEQDLRNVIRKTILEYIGDMGEFGLDEENPELPNGYEDDWTGPTNNLLDDETHDMSAAGDKNIDPTTEFYANYIDNGDFYEPDPDQSQYDDGVTDFFDYDH